MHHIANIHISVPCQRRWSLPMQVSPVNEGALSIQPCQCRCPCQCRWTHETPTKASTLIQNSVWDRVETGYPPKHTLVIECSRWLVVQQTTHIVLLPLLTAYRALTVREIGLADVTIRPWSRTRVVQTPL